MSTIMDIPSQFRSKMGLYDIQIDGVKIKATLVDLNYSSLETVISEFKSHIETNLPVVGVDFKLFKGRPADPALLLLYAKDRCLIIQLHQLGCFPASVGSFLSDKSICFVGLKIDSHFQRIRSKHSHYYLGGYDNCLTGNGAEIRSLAAGVLQNPQLTKCVDVSELASKTELLEMTKPDEASKPSDWSAPFFSKEEIKYAIHDAYYCHKIGKKLLGML